MNENNPGSKLLHAVCFHFLDVGSHFCNLISLLFKPYPIVLFSFSNYSAAKMPALLSFDVIHSLEPTTHEYPIDWQLIWIILGVTVVILFQICAVLTCIWIHNIRSKARWLRLRERGIVIVDGPALIWADDLPPQSTISTFNLRQFSEANQNHGSR